MSIDRSSISATCILAFVAVALSAEPVAAQLTISNPAVAGTKIASCDDYAAKVLNNAWDMSDSADVNNWLPGVDTSGLSNMTFGSGAFSAVAANSDPYFYLISPPLSSSQPSGGRHGGDYPIDSSTYNTLAIRMFTDLPSKLQVAWNFGQDYFPNIVISNPIDTQAGWNTYTIDLNTVGVFSGSPLNKAWNSEAPTGLRIDPTQIAGATVIIDWVHLYGSAGCGSFNAVLNAAAVGNENRYSLFLDEDTDPFNGYVAPLAVNQQASGAASFPIAAAGLSDNPLYVSGFLSSDFAYLTRLDPWDMEQSSDVIITQNITDPAFSGGALSGTTSNSGALIYLSLPDEGISAATFSKVSLKMTRSFNTSFSLIWTVSGGGTHQRVIDPLVTPPNGSGVFEIDMSGFAGWSGTLSSLIINPAGLGAISFSLDFISLRSQGYVNSLSAPTTSASSGTVVVNKLPQLALLQPDNKGGQGFAPWNFDSTDEVPLVENLDVAEILPFNSVGGVTGNFFHGRNNAGGDDPDDPINWTSYYTLNPAGIDSGVYHRLTYRLYIPGDVDIVLGSVARVYWSYDNVNFPQSEDIIVYGGWNEYTVDMNTILTEEFHFPWAGTVNSFRVDAHEFTGARDYYFDYVHLRADDRADDKFVIVFNTSDPDGSLGGLTMSLYYNTTASTSGGTLISTFSPNTTATNGVYEWDTSSVPNGTYYIYATVTDGSNSVARLASGPVVVNHDWSDSTAPVLALEAPSAGYTFDSFVQVKGYSIDEVQVAEIRAYIDGALIGRTYPGNYDSNAHTAYPTLIDSSNAGFNATFDTSAVALGAHTLLVEAIDTSGNKTQQSFSVTKSAGASPVVIAEPTPNGSAIAIPLTGELLQQPIIKKKKMDAKGVLTFTVDDVLEGCTLSFYAGQSRNNITDLFGTFGPLSATEANRGATFKIAGLKKVKGAPFVHVIEDCGVHGSQESPLTKFSLKKGSKATAYPALLTKLRKIKRTSR